MKKCTFLLFPVIAGMYLLFSGFDGPLNPDHASGAPAGNTGSPADGQNCTHCHGGTASTVAGMITSDIPVAGYTAGTSYNITVTVTGSGNKGFEVSPQNVSGTLLGTLTAGVGSKLVGSGKYCTQSSAKTGTAVWTFGWTAPAAGTGSVTFYGAFTASEPVTKLSTLVVSENLVLPLSVAVTANPMSILSGQSSQLNMTATGGSGTYTYSWSSNPAGFTSTLQNPTVSPTATTQYTGYVNDGAGNATNSVTVTVTTPPPLNVTAYANPATINPGGTSILGASVTGGSGSYSFSWTSNPAGFTSTQQSPSVSPTSTTQYTVSVFDGSATQTANTTVTVNANPLTANASATPGTICAGQTTQLDAIGSGGSGTYTYSWTSVPAGFTSSLQNPVVTPSANTTYNVGISDGIGMANASTDVTVTQPATVNAGIDTTYCVNITTFQNSGTSANYASVLWSTSGDGNFTNANTLNSSYTPGTIDKTSGSVTLTLTANPNSPCSGTVTDSRHIIFDPCNGIDDNQFSQVSLNIFPNPAHENVTISIAGLKNQASSLTISDIQGKQLMIEHISGVQEYSTRKDLSDYPKGIYTLRLQTDQKVIVGKIVIQ